MKTITAARYKINEEYRKNKHVKDEDSIKAVSTQVQYVGAPLHMHPNKLLYLV